MGEKERLKLEQKGIKKVEKYIRDVYKIATNNTDRSFVADAWVELFNLTWHGNFGDQEVYNSTIETLSNRFTKSKDLIKLEYESLYMAYDPKVERFIKKVIKDTPYIKIKLLFKLALANMYTTKKESELYNFKKGVELYNEVGKNKDTIIILRPTYKEYIFPGSLATMALKGLSTIKIGHIMPEVISKDLEGNRDLLSNYKGNVVVLDVWATWCAPCIKMIPHQIKLNNKLKNKPFKLISISVDKTVEKVKKFQEKTNMPWIHWYNGEDGGIKDDWTITQYPTIIIVDKKGVIRYRSMPDMSSEELSKAIENKVQELLNE